MRTIKKFKNASRWEKDYQLADWCHTNTHFMYSEMLLQFGFLTLFFSFIPIGPIYALFYNLFDIRTNARNLLKHAKRPLPEKSFGIGATQWNLEFLSKLAILFNSILIGFTSDIIPQFVYSSIHGNYENYIESTMHSFDTNCYKNNDITKDFTFNYNSDLFGNQTHCWFRLGKIETNPCQYTFSAKYWEEIAIRSLASMGIFIGCIIIYQGIQLMFSDHKSFVKDHIQFKRVLGKTVQRLSWNNSVKIRRHLGNKELYELKRVHQ